MAQFKTIITVVSTLLDVMIAAMDMKDLYLYVVLLHEEHFVYMYIQLFNAAFDIA